MESVFLKLVNMSITASWLVFVIILLRLVLRRVPKWVMCLLWGFVAVRLLVPISFESVFSLIPNVETIPNDFLLSREPEIDSGIPIVNQVFNPIVTELLRPSPEASANPAQIWTFIAANIWILGILAMVIYAGVSLFLIKRKLREAVRYDGKPSCASSAFGIAEFMSPSVTNCYSNIWICDHVSSAFILGVFRPRIYLPSDLEEEDRAYVIAHERAHLKRGDHIWKPLGFALLTIYWFNPILWVAYILLCRDIELACDEKVIKKLGVEIKKKYSEALLRGSVSRKLITVCPLAFGEVGVKERVRSVLNYKKPRFWIMVVAVLICIGVVVCLLTNPLNTEIEDEQLEAFLRETIVEYHTSEHTGDNFIAVDWEIMKIEEKSKQTSIYMWVLCEEYSYDKESKEMKEESGGHSPTVITVEKEDDGYELVEYWNPKDGSYYAPSIREKFPIYLWGKAMDSQRTIDLQQERCRAQAKEYFRTMILLGGAYPEIPESLLTAEELNTGGIADIEPISVDNLVVLGEKMTITDYKDLYGKPFAERAIKQELIS